LARRCALYALILLLTLLVAEVLARAYDWSPRALYLATGDRLGMSRYYHAFEGYGDLVPDQDGHWVIWYHRPYHVQTNSVGLRNTEEPSPSAYRILALGDSQTFGPYLANDDTWPAWTENALRLHYRDADKVQVFNGAIAGYTIADELAYLREKGVAFKPDLVLLAVFENDLADLRKEHDGTVQRPHATTPSRLVTTLKAWGRSSALVNLAEQVKTRVAFRAAGIDVRRGEGDAPPSAPPLDTGPLVARYSELYRQTVRLLEANGPRLAVLYIPSIDVLSGDGASELEPLVRELSAETETPYLDLTTALRAKSATAEMHYLLRRDPVGGGWTGNGHLSRAGNAVIGQTVGQWLLETGLVPE
jgi:lysophospholipase L1-like esterase